MKKQNILCILIVIFVLLICCNICCCIYLSLNKMINRRENFVFNPSDGPVFGIGYNYNSKCNKEKISELINMYKKLRKKYENDNVTFKDPIELYPVPDECKDDCQCVWASGQKWDDSYYADQIYKNWEDLEFYYKSFDF